MTKERLSCIFISCLCILLSSIVVIAHDSTILNRSIDTTFAQVLGTETPIPNVPYSIKIGDILQIPAGGNETQPYIYEFNGQKGDVLNITLRPFSNIAPFMSLVLPNQREISAEEVIGNDNSIRRTFQYLALPSDGKYQIKVLPIGLNYTSVLYIFRTKIFPITFSSLVQNSIPENQRAVGYQFIGKANNQIVINVETDGFSPTVDLFCKQQNECGKIQTKTIIDHSYIFTLPVDGEFIVIIGLDSTGGNFKLILSQLITFQINYGRPVEIEFSETNVFYQYSFEGNRDDVIQIHVNSNDQIDTKLTLKYGNDIVAIDDDSGNNFDPEIINKTLYSQGLYTIILQPYVLGESGKVNLDLDRDQVPSLDSGSQIIQLTPKHGSTKLKFTGQAGERVLLSVRNMIAFSTQITILEVRQNGALIRTAYISGTDPSNTDFITQSDGDVYINLLSTSKVEISLQRLTKNSN